MITQPPPFDILLVEDNLGDVRLIREALRNAAVAYRLHAVHDGVQAIMFLRRCGEYAQAPRPKLIVLDLNLPLKDGREVLVDVKSDPDLSRIPIAVFTGSANQSDIVTAYALRANCCVAKPADLDRFVVAVQQLVRFWSTLVLLPDK